MQLLLDAIERAGKKADQRGEVVKAMLATRDLDSPVGRFSIDATGDTSLDRIAGYRIANGKPVFSASLRGQRLPDQTAVVGTSRTMPADRPAGRARCPHRVVSAGPG